MSGNGVRTRTTWLAWPIILSWYRRLVQVDGNSPWAIKIGSNT